MAVNVFIAAKFVMNCMIGICVKENVSVVVKHKPYSMNGMAVNAKNAEKKGMIGKT